MSLKAAICDDNRSAADYVVSLCQEWAEERRMVLNTKIFPSAESFLFQYAEEKDFDVLLLDIEMEGMDGIRLAQCIRQENKTVPIVFITGYSDYISEGYEVEALHYLLKPVNPKKLHQVLDRVLEKLEQNLKFLNLEISGEMHRIPMPDIRWLDVDRNYVTVHARNEYTVKRTLGDFEKELGGGFCRVGRSLIVNLKEVRRVTKTSVILSDGTELPLPRGGYETVNRAISERT